MTKGSNIAAMEFLLRLTLPGDPAEHVLSYWSKDANRTNFRYITFIRNWNNWQNSKILVLYAVSIILTLQKRGKNVNAIPVTGHGGPKGWETLRIPNFVDNQLTDGGEVVSLMHTAAFYPQEESWYSLLFEAKSTSGP
jgi:hypothetical protein